MGDGIVDDVLYEGCGCGCLGFVGIVHFVVVGSGVVV